MDCLLLEQGARRLYVHVKGLTFRQVLVESAFTANWAPAKCRTGSADMRASWAHVACPYCMDFAQVGICAAAADYVSCLAQHPFLSQTCHQGANLCKAVQPS